MGTVVSVVSGKGGVGKTTCCAHLSQAISGRVNKTIVVELDGGLRGMDILFGIPNVVYALDDLLEERCSLEEAALSVPEKAGLRLISAPAGFKHIPDPKKLKKLAERLKKEYDYVIFDCPAGVYLAEEAAKFSDLLIFVVLSDAISRRDAANLVSHIKADKENTAELRLLMNKISKKALMRNQVVYLDDIIDQIGVGLIGILPESKDILNAAALGKPLKKRSIAFQVFDAVAARLDGEDRSLVIK